MILDTLLFICGALVQMIVSVLQAVNWVLPDQITDSIVYFASYLNLFSPFFPVDTFFLAFGYFMSFLGFWYTVKIGMWIFSLLPWFGKNGRVPDLKK